MAKKLSSIDAAARVSHRQLLVVLAFVLLLGIAALLQFADPDLARAGSALWLLMPVATAVIVGTLFSMQKRVAKDSMKAVQNDELRRASLHVALRNGLVATMALQPLLAVGLTYGSFKHEVSIMAAATVIAGIVTVLASVIWCDR